MTDFNRDKYTAAALQDRYGLGLDEAERLITSFGCDRQELDRLIGASDRRQAHRDDDGLSS